MYVFVCVCVGMCLCVCVCVCVCMFVLCVCIPSPGVLISNGFICCDMGLYDKQVLQHLYQSCRVDMVFKFNGAIETNLIKIGLLLYKSLLSL